MVLMNTHERFIAHVQLFHNVCRIAGVTPPDTVPALPESLEGRLNQAGELTASELSMIASARSCEFGRLALLNWIQNTLSDILSVPGCDLQLRVEIQQESETLAA